MPIAHELRQWMWLAVLSLSLWAGLYQSRLLPAPQAAVAYGAPDLNCGSVDEVRTLRTSEWDVPHPAGVSHAIQHDQIALLGRADPLSSPDEGTTISIITPYEDLIGIAQLDFVVDNGTNIAYDAGTAQPGTPLQLLLLNHEQAQLARVTIGKNGLPEDATLTVTDISHLGLESAEGMGVDSTSRRLFLLDSSTLRIVGATLDNVLAPVVNLDLSPLAVSDLRGLAFHPQTGHLFTASAETETLYEFSDAGKLVNSYDLAPLGLVDPRALTFGPSADLTDPADTMHLFLADSYWQQSDGLYGHILELALDPGCDDATGVELSVVGTELPAAGATCSRRPN